MTGLSAFILTRFDRRELVRQALHDTLKLAGAERGFVLLAAPRASHPAPEEGTGSTGGGGALPSEKKRPAQHQPHGTGTLPDGIFVSCVRDGEAPGRDGEAPGRDGEVLERDGGAAAPEDPTRASFASALPAAAEAFKKRCAVTRGAIVAAPLILRHQRAVDARAPDPADSGRRLAARQAEELLGVLAIERPPGAPAFDPQTIAAIESIASCIAAIEASTLVSIEANTDKLTGLLNRASFLRRLREEIAAASRAPEPHPLSLLMVDVHRLDPINRLSGRDKGDEILRLAGKLLQDRVRWSDFAGRLGGDEFIAALPGAGREAALAIASRLRETFRAEAAARGLPPVVLSAGIAVLPDHGSSSSELLRRADQAISAAKKLGPGRALVWSADYSGMKERTDRLEGLLIGDPAEDYAKVLTLLDAIAEVNDIADAPHLLRRLLDRMIEASDAERALLLRPGAAGEPRVAVGRDRTRRDLEGARLRHERRIVEAALLSGEPTTDGACALAIPLATPMGPAGVVYLEGRRESAPYSEPTIAYLDALGHEVALVLERSRMADELARKQHEIESLTRRPGARAGYPDSRGGSAGAEAERRAGRTGAGREVVFPSSGPMREVLDAIHFAARTDSPILLMGETGVGKEVLAREVHRLSRRSAGPFIAVNCAAIPHGLIESELFGHARGSFTGAERERPGLFEEANGGTLFLDEIASTDRSFQAKLLRALQEGAVRRVGESSDRHVDVRVVAAANVELAGAIHSGEFREDLYYRLAVFAIRVPPLRERPSDIPVLANAFLREACLQAERPDPGFEVEAHSVLSRHRWSGNVRELRNVIERLAATNPGRPISPEDVRSAFGPTFDPRGVENAAAAGAGVAEGVESGDGAPETRAHALLEEMRSTGRSFWIVVRTRFLDREITREEVRALVALGMSTAGGSYKKTASLFNIEPSEYKRFLDFLHNHDLRPPGRGAGSTRAKRETPEPVEV